MVSTIDKVTSCTLHGVHHTYGGHQARRLCGVQQTLGGHHVASTVSTKAMCPPKKIVVDTMHEGYVVSTEDIMSTMDVIWYRKGYMVSTTLL